ncbi:replication-associated recombination protein A [bacterium]|nr:replication-associated recombination protein A [bacterium]
MDLFDQFEEEQSAVKKAPSAAAPLAERMRPRTFDEWIGQADVAGPESPLRVMLAYGRLASMILWGPPGCGKTTLARLLADAAGVRFEQLSAVTSGVKDVKEVIERARLMTKAGKGQTLLFIDEIHRFNKAQQDALLPHVENGTILFVGATTENPSFSVIAPLLSRCRVLTLEALGENDLVTLLERALNDAERGLGKDAFEIEDGLLAKIAQVSDGDARRAYNLLEQSAELAKRSAQASDKIIRDGRPAWRLTSDGLRRVLERDHMFYDKGGEEHFNLISAFHKSMRASDPDAALYWLFRMLAAGEDPLWIARRILCMASEDIGLADPQAIQVAVAAYQSFQSLGLPEGELPLAEATIYMATAPKSNAVVVSKEAAKAAVKEHGPLPVPLHLRNAPTGLMKEIGYGREYQYDHDAPEHFSGQPCLPDKLNKARIKFYEPGEFGFEREITKRIEWWNKKREERKCQ